MMKARDRARHKGRREGGTFLMLPGNILASAQWATLDAFEVKLLVDLGSQFNGKNNGDLCAAWTVMQPRGWRSSATLAKAIRGLREKGFIELTRQGGRHTASLYAITWQGINECGNKLDVKPDPVPSNRWKNSLGSRVVMQCARVTMQ